MPINRRINLFMASVQTFVGLSAVSAGLILMLEPGGSPNFLPLSLLENTPFDNFFIPGALLFTVNGLGSLWGARQTWRKRPAAPQIAMGLGLFLLAWISAQVFWFQSVHWLHVGYFALGAIELSLGLHAWLLNQRRSSNG